MAASFPTSYDALTNPTAGSLLTSPSHADQHINANDIVEAIEQRVGLSGSAFPGGPSTGQFFHHTTRRLNYYYDGTRWLSTTLYHGQFFLNATLMPFSATVGTAGLATPWHTTYDLWLETLYATIYVATTNNATNFWTITLQKFNSAFTATGVANFSTASDAANTVISKSVAAGALLTPGTYPMLGFSVTKTASPGNLTVAAAYAYRLVG